MAFIWNSNGPVENDPWTDADGDRPLLSLEDALQSNGAAIGVLIQPADDVRRLEPILDRVALVAVAFPAFNDGRAFSHASLLRDRLNYRGEVRAVGAVLLDQVPLMLRVGINSFAVTHEPTIRRLKERNLPGIGLHYQPTVVEGKAGEGYSWRRRAV